MVVNALAMHNEYVIYEIDSRNIQSRIKLFIGGHTDKSEKNHTG
ncbi:transposase [Neisseria wadsworthii 9715]|uniref:Transposase n=1 Tax=Neisseria wadsworthii 9715 TaxID=1030841 RepID=G4CR12_9NEIS|nr:transposase [Neisseria wadsworthii 9715]